MARSTDGLVGISVYLTPEEHTLVKKLADEEMRSMSAMAKYLLLREVQKRCMDLEEEVECDE